MARRFTVRASWSSPPTIRQGARDRGAAGAASASRSSRPPTLGLPEPEETGTTFAANAEFKARAAARASGLPALADDSGLCVTALDGAPGIYSARWAGPTARHVRHAPHPGRARQRERARHRRSARATFICVLALAWPDEHVGVRGRGRWPLILPPRGERGFGYDPSSCPKARTDLRRDDPAEKHAISHRAQAFESWCGMFNESR